MGAEAKLLEMRLELPEMAKPAGAYVPSKRTGNLVYVAGQLPLKDGELVAKGTVGRNVSVDEAYTGEVTLGRDGIRVSLPSGSTEIEISGG